MLRWVQSILRDRQPDAVPQNMTKSWTDGFVGFPINPLELTISRKVFGALLFTLAPDSIPDFPSMQFTPENAEANLNKIFDAAEKIGLGRLLDAEDVIVCPREYEKSIVTYLQP